jgi:hypothetical protein
VGVRHPAAATFDHWSKGGVARLEMRLVVEHWLETMESLRSDVLTLDNVVVLDLDVGCFCVFFYVVFQYILFHPKQSFFIVTNLCS